MESIPRHIIIIIYLAILSQIQMCYSQYNIEGPINLSPNSIRIINPKSIPSADSPSPPQYYPWNLNPNPTSPNLGGIPYPMLPQNVNPYQQQQPQQLINLGPKNYSTPPCATILTTSNCVLIVPDNGVHNDIRSRNFVLAGAIIKHQCSLTVVDCAGLYSTSSYYFPPPSQCAIASSVCCECNGCYGQRSFPSYENSCGTLFENVECSYCNGFRLEVAKGDQVPIMNALVERKVSSIFVKPGCVMTIFSQPNFLGDAAEAHEPINYLPLGWNDIVASYKCSCSLEGKPPTTIKPIITTLEPVITSTEMPTPSPKLPASTTEIPVPTTELPVPKTEPPTTSTEMPALTTEVLLPKTESPTPTTEMPALTTEVLLPKTESPTPTTEIPALTTEIPVPKTESPTPTTEPPAPTTEVPAPATETFVPTTEIPDATTEMLDTTPDVEDSTSTVEESTFIEEISETTTENLEDICADLKVC